MGEDDVEIPDWLFAETRQAVVPHQPEETSEDEFQVDEVDNVDDSFIGEPNNELIEEPIAGGNHQPELSMTNAHLQELFEHNALLRQRESSLLKLLNNTTDGSFRLIMTPGTDSIQCSGRLKT